MPGSHAIPAPYGYRCPIRHCCGKCDTTCLDVGFETVDQSSVGSLAAMIAEPVLSTGGIIPLPEGYLAKAKEKCDERGMLLIVDEAQTGFVGGGAPLGATITSAEIEAGAYLMEQLRGLHTRHEEIGDVRGRGLLVGVELVTDRDTKQPASALGAAVTAECLRLGLSMNIVKGDGSTTNCLRMAPPLSITREEIDTAIDILDRAIEHALQTADLVIGAVLVHGARAPHRSPAGSCACCHATRPWSTLRSIRADASEPRARRRTATPRSSSTTCCTTASRTCRAPSRQRRRTRSRTPPCPTCNGWPGGGSEPLRTDRHLRNGVNIAGRRLTNAAVAHAQNRPYVAVEEAVAA